MKKLGQDIYIHLKFNHQFFALQKINYQHIKTKLLYHRIKAFEIKVANNGILIEYICLGQNFFISF